MLNNKMFLLASAAAFGMASCSTDTKTETTTTEVTATPPAAVDTLAYRSPAEVLAQRVAADSKIADTAIVRKLKHVYYTRGRALGRLEAAADTAGRYAAIKAANDRASQDVKAILTAPQYAAYAAQQGSYYNGPYTVVVAAPAHRTTLAERVGEGSGIKKLENNADDRKVKFENGAKIKRSDDGSLKIKKADGTKIKIDEHGNRTVK